MKKRVILVTGTPCVGKTSISKMLASKLDAFYINLTQLALKEKIIVGKDEERDSNIVDETSLQDRVLTLIDNCKEKDVVVDGHYAVRVVPRRLVSLVFVLRRDPVILKELMEERGYTGRKLWENLASEILDVSLFEALAVHDKENVCEIEVSSKSVKDSVSSIISILNGFGECEIGIVDWLSKLEREGLFGDYVKI